MNQTDVAKLKELLSRSENILIVPHKNPDGDAIGSSLGLMHFLKSLGHSSTVMVPNEFPRFLKWMPGSNHIVIYEYERKKARQMIADANLIFTLDLNDLSRTGDMQDDLIASQANIVMIDHHEQPGDYATITYSDPSMGSTCEMIYNTIEAMNGLDSINKDMATCLYSGIVTDTGSFKFASATSRTHRVVADLIDKGAQNHIIHGHIFDNNSPSRFKLLGKALQNLVVLDQHKTAYITLAQDELDAVGHEKGDTEGFVNYALALQEIVLAVIFIENQKEGIIKISFRSIGDYSVNAFARKHFEGGGHNNAAGGRSTTDMESTVKKFVSLLAEEGPK